MCTGKKLGKITQYPGHLSQCTGTCTRNRLFTKSLFSFRERAIAKSDQRNTITTSTTGIVTSLADNDHPPTPTLTNLN